MNFSDSCRISNLDVINKVQKEGLKPCCKWLMEECHQRDRDIASTKAFIKAIKKCQAKHQNLLKSKNKPHGHSKLDKFLAIRFPLPTKSQHAIVHRPRSQVHSTFDTCGHETAAIDLAKELAQTAQQLDSAASEPGDLKSRNSAFLKEEHILEQKVSTMEETISTTRSTLQQVTDERDYLKQSKHEAIKKLRRTAAREVYHREQREAMEARGSSSCRCSDYDSVMEELQSTKAELAERRKEISELRSSIEWMEELLNEPGGQTLQTKKGHSYSADMKMCVMELLDNNISASRVGQAIKTVLKLVGIEASDIPSTATVLNYNVERLVLAQRQLGEDLSEKKNTALLTDETSKFGEKYMGYHTADAEGNLWVLGLREMVTKSAQDTLSTYKEILQDIDDRTRASKNETSMKILLHTVATMSDRAATELKFNQLLQDYRKDTLPQFIEGYDCLSEDDRAPLERMYNFFCALHSLVHIAEVSSKAILESEKALLPESPQTNRNFKTSSEPGACRLVRTACKAFAKGADEKSGCHGPFTTYVKSTLRRNNMHSLPLAPYRGNRFNILFENAAYVFFRHDMITFLESHNTNLLLKAVLEDLKTPEYIAGVKALGLISCLITVPLWCMIEDKSVSITDIESEVLTVNYVLEGCSSEHLQFHGRESVTLW